jgi:hypothetical protein
MRARALVLSLLSLSCFPDSTKLTEGGSPSGSGRGGTGVSTGGTGGAGGSGGSTPSANRVALCNQYAAAASAKAFACAPFLSAFRFGTQAAYAQRFSLNCQVFDLPDVHFPPSPLDDCLDQLATESCSDFLDGRVLAACHTSGTRANNAPCATGLQCQSDLCDLSANRCGHCIPAPEAGQSCARGNCADELECNAAGTCVAPGAAGAPCDENHPCLGSLGCTQGVCAGRGRPGAPCTSDQECDLYSGVVCNNDKGTCVSAVVGSMCLQQPDGSYVFCGGGASCGTNSCTPPLADGATCTPPTDAMPDVRDCTYPAQCDTDKRCRIPQPSRTCSNAGAEGPHHPGRPALAGGVGAFLRGPRGRALDAESF